MTTMDNIQSQIDTGFYNLSLLTDDDLYEIADKQLDAGIYFLPGRSGKGWFHKFIGKSSVVLFLRADTQDSILVAVGDSFGKVLENHKYLGFMVRTHREN